MLGILCTSSTFIRRNPADRFTCTLCFENLGLYLNLLEALFHGPEFWNKLIIMIEQGLIVTIAFGILNRTINSIAKLQYFSDEKLSLCK